MQDRRDRIQSVLFGDDGALGVERGIAEFRSGRPVLMIDGNQAEVVLPAEGLDSSRLRAFQEMCSPAMPELAITASRARALGLTTSEAVVIRTDTNASATAISAMAGGATAAQIAVSRPAGNIVLSGIELAKLAHGLPSVLVAGVDATKMKPKLGSIVSVAAESVFDFHRHAARTLKISAEGTVPLHAQHASRFVIFTNAVGDNSVAVIVGTPDVSKPVPVRLHSACLTGDVFGSRRCDCGDQLRLALTRLGTLGGGVILYLAQEGRGLGLANKMRAYQLQDAGLDTVDANTTLGFDEDERSYGIAGRMLQMLGCTRVALLTNNPAKVDALRDAGIEISGRLPLITPINADNRRYLTAKAMRAGHQLGHIEDFVASAETRDDIALKVKLAP